MVYLCERIKGNEIRSKEFRREEIGTKETETKEIGTKEIRILECRSLDTLAAVPEEIDGMPVTELAPYLFSSHENHDPAPRGEIFWWDPAEREVQTETPDLPLLKGDRLEELRLPPSLKKVGAYAFYNCERIRKMELYSTTLDWGAGVFTGCTGVENLTIHVDESRKSCMKEILAELRQTLSVVYLGNQEARLVFSEFFEEAVENTPARIVVTNTHGCGQKYRNAFVNTQFQFQEYDSLFPHVKVQEPETLVCRLALGRMQYPCHLSEKHRQMYQAYLEEHSLTAACEAVRCQDMEELKWLMDHIAYDGRQLDQIIETASRRENGTATSYLLDQKRAKGTVRRKRFQL